MNYHIELSVGIDETFSKGAVVFGEENTRWRQATDAEFIGDSDTADIFVPLFQRLRLAERK